MLFSSVITLATVASALPAFIDLGAETVFVGDDANEARLLKLGPNDFKISTEVEKLHLKRNGQNFIDVTNQISIDEAIAQGLVGERSASFNLPKIWGKQINDIAPIPKYNYPKAANNKKRVKKVFTLIDMETVRKNLAELTSFRTRYYKSSEGKDSADWLFKKVEEITAPLGKNVHVSKVHHNGWGQYSIIASIVGKSDDKVVVGSHQDSANLIFPTLMAAPGADDDGSGTVTILEALRLLVHEIKVKNLELANTLEFHFYSAEEGGLLGSIDVFSRYAKNKETVLGMLQQDMTGYSQGMKDAGVPEHMGLITDYTNVQLNNFIKLLIETYNSIPYREDKCGYACSDHASALENGYPSSFVIESANEYTNKYIHSVMDTLDRLDFEHMREHVQLTIAYAIELATAKNLY
ncbi:hypothetical protein DIURU_004993 [Diutina rugosa]|uniref:Peptide hydrolase n=1 Tax=Diutina rugosa TaxID=5481 RepID=A0A642UFU4_DIURU|nr:uncharacterized protein DIURU_004993 [Diutina rugosa]KAA8898138.1 hypothetical protein DIURU_004993 [Diutina rugosa]